MLIGVYFQTIWYHGVPKKVNIFAWRVMHDRLLARLNPSKKVLSYSQLGVQYVVKEEGPL